MQTAPGRIRAPALLVATVVGIGFISSCESDSMTGPSPKTPLSTTLTDPTVAWTPDDFIGYMPDGFGGLEFQGDTIVAVFQTPVQVVDVQGLGGSLDDYHGEGVKCSGTIGTVIAYNASGNEVGRKDLAPIHPEDCSPPQWPDDLSTWYGVFSTSVAPSSRRSRSRQ